MALRSLLLALALTAACGSVASQSYPGRLLFADTAAVPPFPYRAERDSAAARSARGMEEARAAGEWVCDFSPEPVVEFKAVLDDGREVSLHEYQPFIRSALPEGVGCFVTLKIEWNGTISEARVVRCRGGEVPDETLVPLVRRLRAEVTYYGSGHFPVRWSLPFNISRVPRP